MLNTITFLHCVVIRGIQGGVREPGRGTVPGKPGVAVGKEWDHQIQRGRGRETRGGIGSWTLGGGAGKSGWD